MSSWHFDSTTTENGFNEAVLCFSQQSLQICIYSHRITVPWRMSLR